MAQEHDCTCSTVKGDDLKEISSEPRFEYEYPPPQPDIAYKPIEPKPVHERSDDELLLWFSHASTDKLPKIRKYFKQIYESDGFDIDEMHGVDYLYPDSPSKCPCCPKCYPQVYDKYMSFAQYAIDETYNKDNKKEFKVLEVNSVNGCWSLAVDLFLTFTAVDVDKAGGSDPACKRTFQAVVLTGCRYADGVEEFKRVEMCRLKF